jgi:hypothetical protein
MELIDVTLACFVLSSQADSDCCSRCIVAWKWVSSLVSRESCGNPPKDWRWLAPIPCVGSLVPVRSVRWQHLHLRGRFTSLNLITQNVRYVRVFFTPGEWNGRIMQRKFPSVKLLGVFQNILYYFLPSKFHFSCFSALCNLCFTVSSVNAHRKVRWSCPYA